MEQLTRNITLKQQPQIYKAIGNEKTHKKTTANQQKVIDPKKNKIFKAGANRFT